MKRSRRIFLNPCDYLVFSQHCLMRSKSQGGYLAFKFVDVEGDIAPERIREALAGAMLAHPVTMAPLKISIGMGKPYWRIPARPEEFAPHAAARAHSYDDLRNEKNALTRMQDLIHARCLHRWAVATGPSVRLDQYALPDNRTRFCLRWPHFLMDADGAQQFLAEISRFDRDNSPSTQLAPQRLPTDLRADDETIDVLAGRSTVQRFRLFCRGLAELRSQADPDVTLLHPRSYTAVAEHRLLHRCWNRESVQNMQSNARQLAPPGPARYTRFLAACTIRALHRIYTQCGVETDAYLISLPMRAITLDQEGRIRRDRPVCGNYLISTTLCGRKEHVHDKRALGDDIQRQFQVFLRSQADPVLWAMMWMLSLSRASMYKLLLKLRLGFVPLASGYSCYGEIDRPLRVFGGAKVTNVWGAGLTTTPPGWNPVFSRFKDKLNLSLTYNCPAVSDELARRYVDCIEEEMLEPA
ncbi:MAG: hypothetical protein JXQ75_10095 [Phycisphaerae bacterium]|nr:hypothetical protein [Phycisphaerae bacterium]